MFLNNNLNFLRFWVQTLAAVSSILRQNRWKIVTLKEPDWNLMLTDSLERQETQNVVPGLWGSGSKSVPPLWDKPWACFMFRLCVKPTEEEVEEEEVSRLIDQSQSFQVEFLFLKIDDGPSDDGSLFVPDMPLTFYLFITHHPLPLSPSSFFKRTSFHHVTPPSPPPLLFLPLFLSQPSPLASFNLFSPPALSPFHPSWLPPFAFHPSFFISGYFSSPSIALCFCLH